MNKFTKSKEKLIKPRIFAARQLNLKSINNHQLERKILNRKKRYNEKDNAYRLLDLINKQLNITKIDIDLEREIGHLLGYKEKDIDF